MHNGFMVIRADDWDVSGWKLQQTCIIGLWCRLGLGLRV
jgi:hypothetical protein